MNDDKYAPCPCGSGRKFKFCCYEKRFSLQGVSDRELIRTAVEFPVDKCFISSGWQQSGVAVVVVLRRLPDLTFLLGGYLVDLLCLGVKDAFVHGRLSPEDVREFFGKYAEPLEEISYEDARSVVLGAVVYARQFGFEPAGDWTTSRGMIENERDFEPRFQFGQDGKPFYIQGPEDNAEAIMSRLQPLVKEGRADYLTVAEVDEMNCDDRFDEWSEEISCLIENRRFEDAREEIAGLRAEFPDRWETPFLMGTCLALQGNPEEAIALFMESISLEASPEAYYNLAEAHRALLHVAEWVESLKKTIELDTDYGPIGKRAKDDLDGFAASIRESDGLTLDAYFENQTRFNQAFAYLMEGRFAEAVQGFTEVLSVAPRHVQSHGNLALAYAGLGDRNRAIAHFDRAVELDPGYQPAIDNRRNLLELSPGGRFPSEPIRQVDFYGDRVRSASKSRA